jgi:hypothetical protein
MECTVAVVNLTVRQPDVNCFPAFLTGVISIQINLVLGANLRTFGMMLAVLSNEHFLSPCWPRPFIKVEIPFAVASVHSTHLRSSDDIATPELKVARHH